MSGEVLAMTKGERDRLCVVRAASEGRLSRRAAAAQLDVSRRQMIRLVNRFRAEGDAAIFHRLKGRPGNRRLSEERLRERRHALQLFRERYSDYGPVLLSQTLQQRHQIAVPRETLRCWLLEAKLRTISRRVRARHLRRPRRQQFGELIQLDTSLHDWFEGRGEGRRMISLIKIIDDATGQVFGRFFEGDSVLGNLAVLKEWIQRYGRPREVYSDRHTHFAGMPDADDNDRRYETQIGRCLKELDVRLILAGSPQAKGRVERSFRTDQDRLVKKLRERGIGAIQDANAFLPEYWDEHNRRFARPAPDSRNAHRALTLDQRGRLQDIFAIRESRSLQKGQIIRHEGRDLLLEVRGRRGPHPGVQVEIVFSIQGEMRICYRGTSYPFRDITESRPQRKEIERQQRRRARLIARLGKAGIQPARAAGLSRLEIEALIPQRAGVPHGHPWRKAVTS